MFLVVVRYHGIKFRRKGTLELSVSVLVTGFVIALWLSCVVSMCTLLLIARLISAPTRTSLKLRGPDAWASGRVYCNVRVAPFIWQEWLHVR